MVSFLSHLSPIPSFPAYTGPYKVGTQDVEIPVSELSSPSSAPDPNISTVSFRLFYPCLNPDKTPRSVYWLPSPQTQHFRAYARFLSASPRLAAFLSYVVPAPKSLAELTWRSSYLPIFRTIFYTTIPAIQDAKIASPPESIGRWPVMVFSHGLGGSRNAYSHITGSLASHGMVVIAAEHRDGSCTISYVHNIDGSPPRTIPYRSLPHRSSREVDEGRDEQLKIRLWELGLIHDAIFKLENGAKLSNLAEDPHNSKLGTTGFTNNLDVHSPGKISWAGHSFGAATMIQFLKSVYYPPPSPSPLSQTTLYTPSASTPLSQQITPSSPIALLDLWTQPLRSTATSWLWQHPLPAYSGSSGSPPLAILSEAFYKWRSNLQDAKHALSPPDSQSKSHRESTIESLIFYPLHSAHLSQSDFGPLFPWLTRKIFKAEDPERTVRLNVRAILENLRRSGIKVADTSKADMELEASDISGPREIEEKQRWPLGQDHRILNPDGNVRGWVAVGLDEGNGEIDGGGNGHAIEAGNPGEAVMKGEVMK